MKTERLHRLVILDQDKRPNVTGLVRASAAGGSVRWAGRWWRVVDILCPIYEKGGTAVAYLRQVEGPTP